MNQPLEAKATVLVRKAEGVSLVVQLQDGSIIEVNTSNKDSFIYWAKAITAATLKKEFHEVTIADFFTLMSQTHVRTQYAIDDTTAPSRHTTQHHPQDHSGQS